MTLTLKEAKAKGSRVSERLAQLGINVSHAQALEVVATVYGDATWHALNARLAPVKRAKKTLMALSWFTVAMYRCHEDGDSEFLAKLSTICFTAEQARELILDKFWHPQYDNVGYHASYDTSQEEFWGMPDTDEVAQWLADLVETMGPREDLRLSPVWDALVTMGAERVRYDDDAINTVCLKTALNEVAKGYTDASALFSALYRELGNKHWFSSQAPDAVDVSDDSVTFADQQL